MKELYKVKVPKHLKIGDPWYFKREEGSELERLTVDEDPRAFRSGASNPRRIPV